MLDLADLEAHHSRELVCPDNLIGTVDVYHVNVHGQFKGIAPELIGALHPRVAIMGNGATKGADPQPGRFCALRRAWKTSGRSTTRPMGPKLRIRPTISSPTWNR